MTSKHVAVLLGCLLLYGLIGAAPTIIAVANAVVPALLVLALVVAALRLLWFYTQR